MQTFVERITGHQLVELAEHGRVPAERQLRVDLRLDRGLPPIGQPGRHWRDEVVVRQISENVAAPERSCLIELAHGLSQCAVGSSRSPLSTRPSNAAESSASEKVEFGASGTVITFRGFLAAYEEGRDDDGP